MASKSTASIALFFALNLLFLSLVSACGTCSTPTPKPNPTVPKPSPTVPKTPKPSTTPTPSSKATCPRDTLKLGVCANVLGGLLAGITLGNPPTKPCCALIEGLVDLEAAVCLCTAIKANVLGINLNVPLSLSLLLNVCGKKAPSGWKCA